MTENLSVIFPLMAPQEGLSSVSKYNNNNCRSTNKLMRKDFYNFTYNSLFTINEHQTTIQNTKLNPHEVSLTLYTFSQNS
jgi:hypothetical protein